MRKQRHKIRQLVQSKASGPSWKCAPNRRSSIKLEGSLTLISGQYCHSCPTSAKGKHGSISVGDCQPFYHALLQIRIILDEASDQGGDTANRAVGEIQDLAIHSPISIKELGRNTS